MALWFPSGLSQCLSHQPGMLLNLIKYRGSHLQRATRHGAVEFRRVTSSDGVEKRVELELERFDWLDRKLIEGQSGISAHSADSGRLFGIVERNILAGLKDAHFADFFGRDAARRK